MTTAHDVRQAQAINARARERLTEDRTMNDIVEVNERAPMSVRDMLGQVQTIQHVMKSVMIEGIHYGKIPGTQANTLFKAGAETLAATFRIAPRYDVEDLSASPDEVRLRVKCIGVHQRSSIELGQGMGEASTNEEKYKWRRASSKREYDATPPDRRRVKFGYNAKERKEFETQQVRVEPADISNTVLKMACKRAEVAMILTVLAAGDIFSQDLEDMPEDLRAIGPDTPAREVRQPEAPPAAAPAANKQPGEAGEQLMTSGQLKIIRAKMQQFNVEDKEVEAMFGVALEKLPFAMFGEVQAFVSGPG